MKSVEYIGKTELEKFKCGGYDISISDFEYTSKNDGETYLMYIKNKGYHGSWHIIKSLLDNKLYATNNLWTKYEKEIKNAVVVKLDITEDEVKKANEKEEIIYLNNLNFFGDEKEKIEEYCEKSILMQKEKEYIILNTKYYLKISTDSEDLWIQIYSKPNVKTGKINYNISYGCNYGDNEEKYDTLDETIEKCVDIIKNHENVILNTDDCIKNYYNDEEIIDKLLGTSKNNEITDLIQQKLKKYNISMYTISNTLGGKYFNYFLSDNVYEYIKQKGFKIKKFKKQK